jgi:hypothetical protein
VQMRRYVEMNLEIIRAGNGKSTDLIPSLLYMNHMKRKVQWISTVKTLRTSQTPSGAS